MPETTTLLTRHFWNSYFLTAASISTITDCSYFNQIVFFKWNQKLSRCIICLQNMSFALSVLPIENLYKRKSQVNMELKFVKSSDAVMERYQKHVYNNTFIYNEIFITIIILLMFKHPGLSLHLFLETLFTCDSCSCHKSKFTLII